MQEGNGLNMLVLNFFSLLLFCYMAETAAIPNQSTRGNADIVLNIAFITDRNSTRKPFNVSHEKVHVTTAYYDVNVEETYQVFKLVHRLDLDPRVDLVAVCLVDQLRVCQAIAHTEDKQITNMFSRARNENVCMQVNVSADVTEDQGYGEWTTSICGRHAVYLSSPAKMPQFLARVLTELVLKQRWSAVYVVFDRVSEPEALDLADSLSIAGVMFSLFDIDDVSDLHVQLVEIWFARSRFKSQINFVVLGQEVSMNKIVTVASRFDALNTEQQTLLGLFSSWIVVPFDNRARNVWDLKLVAQGLNNVAVLHVRQTLSKTIEERVRQAVHDIQMPNSPKGTTTKKNYIEQFVKSLIATNHFHGSNSTHYTIHTLLHTDTGPELKDVGHADYHGNVHLNMDLFPNTKYGYGGKLFTVTTLSYPPFVMKRHEDNRTIYEGPFIDLLQELSRVLNFTFKMIGPPDGKWGSVDHFVKDTPIFNGMIGQLQRRECDLAAAPLSVHPTRDMVADFSYPVYHEYTTVMVKRSDPNAQKWRTLLNPLKAEVLFAIGLTLPAVTFLLCLTEYCIGHQAALVEGRVQNQRPPLQYLLGSFWNVYGALMCQGSMPLPKSFSGRTILTSWLLFGLVVVGTYSGNLIAFLTVNKVTLPFNSLKEMGEKDEEYTWGVAGATNLEIIFTSSGSPGIRNIGDLMMEFNKTDPSIFHVDAEFHIDRVKRDKYAYIGEKTEIKLAMLNSCDLRSIKDEFLPTKNAFAFPENSPHTRIFSEQIMKIEEAGLFEMWRRKWWPKQSTCTGASLSELSPTALRDVQGAFYVCLIGIVAGSIMLFVEMAHFKLRNLF